MFPLLCFSSLWLRYFVTEGLCLLFPFTRFPVSLPSFWPLLFFFYSVTNTSLVSASWLLLYHGNYVCVCVCADAHMLVFSDNLQCHFATCWFWLTLKLQGEMIGLTNALEVSLSYRLTACGQVSARHPLPVQSPVTWELGSAATHIRIRNSMTIKRSVRTASTWHQLRLCWNELEGTFKAFQYRNQNVR